MGETILLPISSPLSEYLYRQWFASFHFLCHQESVDIVFLILPGEDIGDIEPLRKFAQKGDDGTTLSCWGERTFHQINMGRRLLESEIFQPGSGRQNKI